MSPSIPQPPAGPPIRRVLDNPLIPRTVGGFIGTALVGFVLGATTYRFAGPPSIAFLKRAAAATSSSSPATSSSSPATSSSSPTPKLGPGIVGSGGIIDKVADFQSIRIGGFLVPTRCPHCDSRAGFYFNGADFDPFSKTSKRDMAWSCRACNYRALITWSDFDTFRFRERTVEDDVTRTQEDDERRHATDAAEIASLRADVARLHEQLENGGRGSVLPTGNTERR